MLEGQHFEPQGPLAQFMRMVDAFRREDIELAVDALIARLDHRDGDADYEEPSLEDSFIAHKADGPGCPVSDVSDPAWIEWESRGRDKLASFAIDATGQALHEDAEDDDAREQDDEPEDDDSDRCIAGDDMIRSGPTFHLIDWRAPTDESPGHEPGNEDDAEPEDRMAKRERVRRIRNRACTATVHRSYGVDHTTYRLREFNTVAIGSASDLLTAP